MTSKLVALLCGCLISLALFWLMQFMISNNQQSLVKKETLHMTEFVRLKREDKIETRERKLLQPPPPEKKLPPPPQMEVNKVTLNKAPLPKMEMPNLDIPQVSHRFDTSLLSGVNVGAETPSDNLGALSHGLIPLVRIEPKYPLRAQRRRITGRVQIEFTITVTGTVKDAVVVSAQPSEIFNHSALKAIRRWKFKPKFIDGKAVEQRAVQVMEFNLAK